MLSKPIGRSPRGASSYYYQTESKTNSLWGGKGAEDLALKGQVKIEQFNSVLDGFNPSNSEKLRQNAGKENAIAGWDFTFSLSKNASILAFQDKRIEKAFRESVDEALKIAEERYSATRTGKAGVNKEHTGNLIFAKFTHYNSRANDPQVHTHILILNTTKGSDGNWRSLDNRELYSNYKHIGLIQEHILANKLKELGYKLEIDRKTGIADIRTGRDDIKEFFSKRSNQIKEEYEKYKNDFLYERDAKQKASWDTREEKDHNFSYREMKQKLKEELKQNFDISLKELKQNAISLNKSQSLLNEPDRISRTNENLNEIIKDSLSSITKTQSAFTYKQLEDDVLKRTLGQGISLKEIENAIDESIRKGETIKLGEQKSSKYSFSKTYYTTPEILRIEKETVETIRSNPKTENLMDKVKAKEFIEERELINGFRYTDGQKEFIEKALTNKEKYLIVQGNAGSGKTASIEAINKAYVLEGYRVIGIAPTGKATNLLKESGIRETYTIAKFKQEIESGNLQVDGTELNRKTVIITDEASMVSSRDMHFIINQNAEKIILVGDTKQFKPIEQGKIFEDIQRNVDKGNFVDMQETVRFKTESQKEIANLMNKGNFKGAFERLDELGKVREIKESEEKLNAIKDSYIKHIENGKDILLIANTNQEKDLLNEIIREELKSRGYISNKEYTIPTYTPKNLEPSEKTFAESYSIDDKIVSYSGKLKGESYIVDIDKEKNLLTLKHNGDTFQIDPKKLKESAVYEYQEKQFSEGDKIIFLKNDKSLNVANGEVGTVLNIDDGRLTAVKENGEVVTISTNPETKDSYNYIDHAYSVTNYKSQGQTSDITIYSHSSDTLTNQESFYVASTRAKEETIVYTDNKEMLSEQIEIEQSKVSTLDFEQEKIQNQTENQVQAVEQVQTQSENQEIDSEIEQTEEKIVLGI